MLILYGTTIFLGAALVFLMQPMFARMVLPLLGGTPAAWNTCLVFFQAVLLAGYAYAHASTRWFGVRRQALVHLVVMLAPLAVLPIAVPASWSPPADHSPLVWLLALLAVSVGAPFFAVSTTAPLVQKWFAETRHSAAHDPYFLYAASNLGSMLALVAYPLVVEPNLPLRQQAWWWACAYGVLVVLLASCAWTVRQTQPAALPSSPRVVRRVTGVERARWVLLALVPSSWLLGVTTHLTTDIAPVPLLWILPLALYLLSFILAFAQRQAFAPRWIARVVPLLAVLLVVASLGPGAWPVLALHLVVFFAGAVACHGELARLRPATSHLTEFYFWMSLGGVLGGTFNALIAPLVFRWPVEYPLAIVCACLLLRPDTRREAGPAKEGRGRTFELGAAVSTTLLVAVVWLLVGGSRTERPVWLAVVVVASIPVLLLLFVARRRVCFALLLAAPLVLDKVAGPFAGEVLYTGRGYFGVHRVIAHGQGNERYHHLLHGGTVHGRQSRDPSRFCEPLTYFHPTGPLGQIFQAFRGSRVGREVAVIGLGSGAMACYVEPSRRFTFYELDPLVQHIATTRLYFSYLSECAAGHYRVVLGDGRLSLSHAKDGAYGLIMIDAFSSDAIPVHLLTREAMQLYLRKLQDRGIVVFHVTNNYLDLEAVLASQAKSLRLVARACHDAPTREQFDLGKTSSTWVVLARRPEDLRALANDDRWQPARGRPGLTPWRDDFSNIVRVLKWQ